MCDGKGNEYNTYDTFIYNEIHVVMQIGKEKKQLEEKLAETLTALQDEEDKSKGLGKMKAKHEASITDLEDRLRNEERARQELEKEKRKLLAEIAELKEQLLDAKQRVSRCQMFTIHSQKHCSKFPTGWLTEPIWPGGGVVFIFCLEQVCVGVYPKVFYYFLLRLKNWKVCLRRGNKMSTKVIPGKNLSFLLSFWHPCQCCRTRFYGEGGELAWGVLNCKL